MGGSELVSVLFPARFTRLYMEARKWFLGIKDGHKLPELILNSDLIMPATELKLDPVYLGSSIQGDSWLVRILPFIKKGSCSLHCE